MPDSPKTPAPTHLEVLVLGRPGGGLNGAPGGLCWFDGGSQIRVEPGDVVEVPVKVAAGLLAEGWVTEDTEPEPESTPEPDAVVFDFNANADADADAEPSYDFDPAFPDPEDAA